MKFVISTEEFSRLVSKCLNIISQKPTQPILANILVEASNNMLTLTATDLTVGVRCRAEAKVFAEGSTTLPAKRLGSLLRELTAVNVEIQTSEKHITEVVADTSKFRLHGTPIEGFPSLPEIDSATSFSVEQKQFKDVLYRTAFSVAREDSRYQLTGLYMRIEESKAIFIGTDGKRLARSFIRLDIDPSIERSYIIPLKAVDEALKILEGDGNALVYMMKDKVAIESGQSILITKLLTGEYPDVTQVIPTESDIKVALHREELLTLLRQVALFSDDESRVVLFSFENGQLCLSANAMDVGEGKVNMPVNYSGTPFEIAFNTNYFQDILRHSDEDSIEVGLTDKFNPALISDFELEGKERESSSEFVLMPLRFEG